MELGNEEIHCISNHPSYTHFKVKRIIVANQQTNRFYSVKLTRVSGELDSLRPINDM